MRTGKRTQDIQFVAEQRAVDGYDFTSPMNQASLPLRFLFLKLSKYRLRAGASAGIIFP